MNFKNKLDVFRYIAASFNLGNGFAENCMKMDNLLSFQRKYLLYQKQG